MRWESNWLQALWCSYQQPYMLPDPYVARVALKTTSKARPSSVTGTLQAGIASTDCCCGYCRTCGSGDSAAGIASEYHENFADPSAASSVAQRMYLSSGPSVSPGSWLQ